MICAVYGALVGLGGWMIPRMGYPSWLSLLFPWAILGCVLLGFYKYDWLVLVTFSLIGIVKFEPAPFDLLFILTLALGFAQGKLKWPSTRHGRLAAIGVWGFVIANFLSIIGIQPFGQSLRFLGITLYMLVLFWFMGMYVVEESNLKFVLIGFLISALVNSLAVLLWFLGFSLPFNVVAFSTRALGFFKDFNVYGPFLVVAAIWFLDYTIHKPFHLVRTLLSVTTLGILIITSALSLSRGAWVNMAVAVMVYAALLYYRAPRIFLVRSLWLSLVVVLVGILVFGLFGLNEVILERLQFQDYDTGRFETQREGVLLGLTNYMGVGPSGLPNAHSLYVRTFAEHGLLGILMLGLLIVGILLPLLLETLRGDSGFASFPNRVLIAIICGQIVNALVIDTIHWRHFWMVLGLAWASLLRQNFLRR